VYSCSKGFEHLVTRYRVINTSLTHQDLKSTMVNVSLNGHDV
jgi:hypothetical protein